MGAPIILLSDPLIDDFGPGRVTVLLAQYFSALRETSVVAPLISPEVETQLQGIGVEAVSLGQRPRAKTSSMVFVESWLREALFFRNSYAWKRGADGSHMVVNLSNCLVCESHIWYMLGSVSDAIRAIVPNLSPVLQFGVRPLIPLIKLIDSKQILSSSRKSSIHVACSLTCRRAYERLRIPIDDVIYPPNDTSLFHPSAERPTEAYCLTYLGKETRFDCLYELASAGVEILAFGAKFQGLPRELLSHPRVHHLGKVDNRTLVDLYSNAKFTAVPLSTEPFGYVPVESMACGTPVLTLDREGPSETVLNGQTGWTAASDEMFVRLGERIWKAFSVPESMRRACRKRALEFSVENVGKKWIQWLERLPSHGRATSG